MSSQKFMALWKAAFINEVPAVLSGFCSLYFQSNSIVIRLFSVQLMCYSILWAAGFLQ